MDSGEGADGSFMYGSSFHSIGGVLDEWSWVSKISFMIPVSKIPFLAPVSRIPFMVPVSNFGWGEIWGWLDILETWPRAFRPDLQ